MRQPKIAFGPLSSSWIQVRTHAWYLYFTPD